MVRSSSTGIRQLLHLRDSLCITFQYGMVQSNTPYSAACEPGRGYRSTHMSRATGIDLPCWCWTYHVLLESYHQSLQDLREGKVSPVVCRSEVTACIIYVNVVASLPYDPLLYLTSHFGSHDDTAATSVPAIGSGPLYIPSLFVRYLILLSSYRDTSHPAHLTFAMYILIEFVTSPWTRVSHSPSFLGL